MTTGDARERGAQRDSDDERNAELDRVLIGGREKRAIVVVRYDPAWAERFETIHSDLKSRLADVALLIEHIGSTSVPGLAAKPIIDVLVTVGNVADDEPRYRPPIEAAGYVLRVLEPEHRMFRTPALDVHVHVWADDDPEVQPYLDLRDWLRVDASDRELYARTKLELAKRDWEDMNYYADAKSDVVRTILEHARAWRAAGEPR